MLISHRHRFAFVHVPKTGGSSVCYALWPFADHVHEHWSNRWLDRIGIHVNHFAPYRLKRFRTHTSAAVLQRQLPPAVFADLFKFAFVRNPWDLLVSSYHFLLRDGGGRGRHHRHGRVARLPDFEAYVRYEIRRGRMSQVRMLTDDRGRMLVDFVGHHESLAADFDHVCRSLGLAARLDRHNASQHRDYRDYYTAPLVALVRDHFAADIERFGYAFEGEPRAVPIAPACPPAHCGIPTLAWAG